MRGAFRVALRLLDRDVFRAGQLGHPLHPAGDAAAAGDLGREVQDADAGAGRGLIFHSHVAAVVERAAHLRGLRKERRRGEHHGEEAIDPLHRVARGFTSGAPSEFLDRLAEGVCRRFGEDVQHVHRNRLRREDGSAESRRVLRRQRGENLLLLLLRQLGVDELLKAPYGRTLDRNAVVDRHFCLPPSPRNFSGNATSIIPAALRRPPESVGPKFSIRFVRRSFPCPMTPARLRPLRVPRRATSRKSARRIVSKSSASTPSVSSLSTPSKKRSRDIPARRWEWPTSRSSSGPTSSTTIPPSRIGRTAIASCCRPDTRRCCSTRSST